MSRAFAPVLGALLLLMVLAFLPGLEQPGRAPREALLLVAAPLLLALALLDGRRARPHRLLLTLTGLGLLPGLVALVGSSPTEMAAVGRDLAVLAAPWLIALAVSLRAGRGSDEAGIGSWIDGAVVVSLAATSLLGLAQAWVGWEGLQQSRSPAATFVNRNVAAQALVLLLPLALPGVLAAGKPRSRWLGAVVIGLGLAFLVATRSRGAWLGLAAGCGVGALVWFTAARRGGWRPFPPWGPILLLLALGGVSVLVPVRGPAAPAAVSERLRSLARDSGGSEQIRRALWSNTIALVSDRPWVGVGPGRFPVEYPRYQSARVDTPWFGAEWQAEHAHNDLLEFAAELGFPAALALITLVAGAAVRSAGRARSASAGREAARWAARSAALTGLLVHGLVSFPLHTPAGGFLAWLLVGWVWGSTTPAGRGRGWRRVTAWVLASLVLPAAWIGLGEIRAQRALGNALRARAAGACAEALHGARQAASEAPWRRRDRGMAAAIYFDCERDPARSLAVLEPALELQPHQLNLLLAVGARRLKDGRTAQAESAFLHAVDLAPSLGRAWLGLAMTRNAVSDRAGAAEACAQAVRLAPYHQAARAFCEGNGYVRE